MQKRRRLWLERQLYYFVNQQRDRPYSNNRLREAIRGVQRTAIKILLSNFLGSNVRLRNGAVGYIRACLPRPLLSTIIRAKRPRNIILLGKFTETILQPFQFSTFLRFFFFFLSLNFKYFQTYKVLNLFIFYNLYLVIKFLSLNKNVKH